MRFALKKINKSFGLLWQALMKFRDDNGFFLSSGITFSVLINLIPFIMLLLAFVGTYLYHEREMIDHVRAYFRDVAPALDPKVMTSLTGVMQNRRIVGIAGFISLFWLSTLVFDSLRIALNIVFRADARRGMLRAIGINLLMVLMAGILLLLSIVLSLAATFLYGHQAQLPVEIGPTVQWILRYLLPFFLTYCMFCLIYKIIPDKRVHFKSALQAALFTSLLWELAKHLFAWYVLHLARYSIFYGSLSTVVIFVFWAYYSSTILIVGAEVAYLLEEDR